ncbi:MAG: radical SAM protein [Planctomycetota bacterium]
MTNPLQAPLVEVFASIQGEGRLVGRPMAFVRVAVCPLRCTYCDTPDSYAASPEFPVTIGADRVQERNPVTGARAAALALEAARHSPFGASPDDGQQMVAVTGGEPLLYPGFVHALGEVLHDAGARLFLETAALHPDALESCLDVVDHLSADYKLPETLVPHAAGASGNGDPGEQSVACVERAVARAVPVDVKIVLTPAVRDESLRLALERLRSLRDGFTLILQPVTPFGRETRPLPKQRLLALSRLAAAAGFAPLVIPQTHKLLDLP